MRILVLNYEYPPLGGGGAPVCEQLCRHFARRDHSVDVVTMGFKGLPPYEERDGVRITRVPALRKNQATCETPEMLSYVVSALPRTIYRLWRRPYDIVHVHFVVPTGLLAYLATFIIGTPYVVTAHGSDIPGHNPDRFQKEHRYTLPLVRRILSRAALITSPSLYLRDRIRTTCGPYDVTYIPNGIDINRFDPKPRQPRILMVGRLLPLKGFQFVLEALKNLDTDYEVHIAGDGPMREELERLAAGLRPKVIFHGWLDNDSPLLRELYETSSIFCLPSERENASIALLEAMLAEMAVVTSNAAGCPETVGDAGIVVPPRNAEAIRAALESLMNDEERREALGRKARARVTALFDWEKLGDEYLARLQEIVERRKR